MFNSQCCVYLFPSSILNLNTMKQNLKLYLVEYVIVIIWREEKKDKDKITSKQIRYCCCVTVPPLPPLLCLCSVVSKEFEREDEAAILSIYHL